MQTIKMSETQEQRPLADLLGWKGPGRIFQREDGRVGQDLQDGGEYLTGALSLDKSREVIAAAEAAGIAWQPWPHGVEPRTFRPAWSDSDDYCRAAR